MRRLLVVVFTVLLFGALIAAGALYAPGSSGTGKIDAEELIAQASSADVLPPTGDVLKLTYESYNRGHVEGLDVEIPNDKTSEVWLRMGDEPGAISERYAIVRDAAGNVVQEEFFDGEREYVYSAPHNAVIVMERPSPMRYSPAIDLNELLADESSASYEGERIVDGRSVHIIHFVQDATDESAMPAGSQDSGYRGIYTGDLTVRRYVTELALDVETLVPTNRSTSAIDDQGVATLLISKKFTAREVVPAEALPGDLFALHHVPPNATWTGPASGG
jgi:hypothetical protein